MVTQGILTLVLTLVQPIVNWLPDVDLSGLDSVGSTFLSWVSLAAYMLPMGTVYSILGIIISLQIFRIVVAFFKSLWGVLPVA